MRPGGLAMGKRLAEAGKGTDTGACLRHDKIQDGQTSINGPSDFAHPLGTDAFEASTLIVIIPSSSLPSLRDLVLVSRYVYVLVSVWTEMGTKNATLTPQDPQQISEPKYEATAPQAHPSIGYPYSTNGEYALHHSTPFR